jgi:hypothetical protein
MLIRMMSMRMYEVYVRNKILRPKRFAIRTEAIPVGQANLVPRKGKSQNLDFRFNLCRLKKCRIQYLPP